MSNCLLNLFRVRSVVIIGDCLLPLMNILTEFGMGKKMLMITQFEVLPLGVRFCSCTAMSNGGISVNVILCSWNNFTIDTNLLIPLPPK